MKGDVVTPQILFLYVEFLDGGKWEKHFPVLFSGNMGGGGGRVSPHPRYGKAEVLTLGNLYVNEILANIRSNKRQEKEALQFSH